MHALQLAELASWAAFNSTHLVFGIQPQNVFSTSRYWTNSKCRQQRWITALKMFEKDVASPASDHDPVPAMAIVVQEILLSEMLSRVWSATMVAHDDYQRTDELHGVAHSIHIGQIEAKNRALKILLSVELESSEVFERLNQLRRKVERWTDLLLGQLPIREAATTFAIQANRVKDYGTERDNSDASELQVRQALYAPALSEDLRRVTSQYPANPYFNREIAAGVLACFPADRFDSKGLPKSVQLLWMEKASDDTQILLDGLRGLEDDAMGNSITDQFKR